MTERQTPFAVGAHARTFCYRSTVGPADAATTRTKSVATKSRWNGAECTDGSRILHTWDWRRVSAIPTSAYPVELTAPISAAVRNAYIASLESQISSLRDEMAAVYKTQGQNAQRLLAMNETLREKEEVSRISSEDLRRAREEITVLRRKVDQHDELMTEKNERLQVRFVLYFATLSR